jgi:hypothetical protein
MRAFKISFDLYNFVILYTIQHDEFVMSELKVRNTERKLLKCRLVSII